MHRRMQLNS